MLRQPLPQPASPDFGELHKLNARFRRTVYPCHHPLGVHGLRQSRQLELESQDCARSQRAAQRPHPHPTQTEVVDQRCVPRINMDHGRPRGPNPATLMLASLGDWVLAAGQSGGDVVQGLGQGLKGHAVRSPATRLRLPVATDRIVAKH